MFGERLEAALKLRKQSRKWLASKLGVSESAITQVINGQAKAMNAANCARTAHFLEVNALWLATGDGAMTAEPAQLWRTVAFNLATATDAAERGQRFAQFVKEVDEMVEKGEMARRADQPAPATASH